MRMDLRERQDIVNMESMIFACYSGTGIEDVPQVASDDDIMVELMQDMTLRPHDVLEAELHHQIDPAYDSE